MLRRHLLITLLTLAVSGCGFQLRGSFNLPPNLKALKVDGEDPYSTLLVQTRDLLNSAGVATTDDAPYTLYVSKEELGKTRFTQNQNVLLDEFMLTHEATIELRRRDGTLITKPLDLTEMTLFQDDQSTAGTKLNEENILRDELAQKLAVKILRRVQAVKPSQWEAESGDSSDVKTETLDDNKSSTRADEKQEDGKKSATPSTSNSEPLSTPATGNSNAPAP